MSVMDELLKAANCVCVAVSKKTGSVHTAPQTGRAEARGLKNSLRFSPHKKWQNGANYNCK